MPDWFMMKYSISECPDSVEAFGEILSDSDVAGHIGNNWLQQPRPEYFFIAHVKQACPKTEGQFWDYSSCVKRLLSFDKNVFCFLYFVDFLRGKYSRQVKPCIGFEMCRGGIMNAVSEADFQALKRGVKTFR